MPRILSMLASLALAFWSLTAPAFADGRTLFIASAQENGDGTAWLPVYHGTSGGSEVLYVILDTSSGSLSQSLGVNESQKLANAANTPAVQRVTSRDVKHLDFPATVDFSPQRVVVAGPDGFPPAAAAPGAVGKRGYSPLVQLPDGTVVNAPHILNQSGHADKALAFAGGRVKLLETAGFQGGKPVMYISTDASDPGAAALENSTYAPQLNGAPTLDDDSTHSARASLAAFVNGQTGATNPQRQGLNSAILDGLSPLNVLRWNPSQGRYSPLWDVHPAAWAPGSPKLRQSDWNTIQGLVDDGQITGPGGAKFGPANFIVDCPIISQGI